MFSKKFAQEMKDAQDKIEHDKKNKQEQKEFADLESCKISLQNNESLFILSIPVLPAMLGPGPTVKSRTEKVLSVYPGSKLLDVSVQISPEKSLGSGHIIISIRIKEMQPA